MAVFSCSWNHDRYEHNNFTGLAKKTKHKNKEKNLKMCTYHREGRRAKFKDMICFHFYDAKYPVTELEMWKPC